MKSRKIPVISFALYIVAGLLMLYTIWALYHSHIYISEMMVQNQLTFNENQLDIVNFYMANSAQYVLFAVVLSTLGWLLQKSSADTARIIDLRNRVSASKRRLEADTDEEDFDKWFQNNNV